MKTNITSKLFVYKLIDVIKKIKYDKIIIGDYKNCTTLKLYKYDSHLGTIVQDYNAILTPHLINSILNMERIRIRHYVFPSNMKFENTNNIKN